MADSRRLKALGWIAALVLLALLAWTASGPWRAVAGIREAVQAGDARALARHVDFPALRASLRPQVQDRIVRVTKQSGYLDCWLLDQPAAVSPVTSRCGRNCIEGGLVYAVPDRYLRPIRCDGLGDETPTDAEQPQPAEA